MNWHRQCLFVRQCDNSHRGGSDRQRPDAGLYGWCAQYRLYETLDGWLCIAALVRAAMWSSRLTGSRCVQISRASGNTLSSASMCTECDGIAVQPVGVPVRRSVLGRRSVAHGRVAVTCS